MSHQNEFNEKCFACGKKLKFSGHYRLVDTRDGQLVYVGLDCYKKIEQSPDGYLSPHAHAHGGPKLYLIEHKNK
jgi:hypothetical protein